MKSGSTVEEPVIAETLRELIREKTSDLRMLPDNALLALDIVNRPDCDISEFSAVIERDMKLASDVLAMANSVAFCRGQKVSSLRMSVVRLGFRQCRNLIVSTSLSSLMKSISLKDQWTRSALWRHSLLTGVVAININRTLCVGFQGEEFAAGLIHDFGRLLFAISLPDRFSIIDPLEFDESEDVVHKENQSTGSNHCDLGAWFARGCHLPSELVDAIQFHHTPSDAVRNKRLVALTAACDHLANHIQRLGGPDGYDFRQNSALLVLESCGVADAAERLLQSSEELMETIMCDALTMGAL
ncbi:MAG: HDOD domain-containing protein [Planctomycetaceae bacterium]|nr:HDOD domain-containing protein [Planctomycetaceae bacterium]